MLLTLPWLGSIILGRVDIINGQARDGVTKKFNIKSFVKQVMTCKALPLHVHVCVECVACGIITRVQCRLPFLPHILYQTSVKIKGEKHGL